MPLLRRNITEGRGVDLARRGIEPKGQIAVAIERPQRMIKKVIRVHPQLEVLALRDVEVLEQAEVGIEVRRSIDGRQRRRTVLPDLIGEGEAALVDELVRAQIRLGVA